MARKREKASAQLVAFPSSENQKRRQHAYGAGAVVSVRFTGQSIVDMDAEANRLDNERGMKRPWDKRTTRTDVIHRAVKLYFETVKQPKKKG